MMTLTELLNGINEAKDPDIYIQSLSYRDYIPILDKQQIMYFITAQDGYSSVEMEVCDFQTKLFFHVLLRYIFVEVERDEMDEVNIENYDMLVPLLRSYILSFARDDYEEFVSMIDRTLNLYGLSRITDAFDALDQETINEGIINNAEMMAKLREKEELIHELSEIAALNNPLTHKMIEGKIK